MITGHPPLYFLAGIWNCTYIWPIVICWGVGAAGGGAPAAAGGGTVAWSVIFGTPPTKKLPWSSIVSGPPRNFFGFALVCAETVAAIATHRQATEKRLIDPPSRRQNVRRKPNCAVRLSAEILLPNC